MTIDEAIERLNALPMPVKTYEDRRNRRAVILGIQALKEIRRQRDNEYRVVCVRLLGETR